MSPKQTNNAAFDSVITLHLLIQSSLMREEALHNDVSKVDPFFLFFYTEVTIKQLKEKARLAEEGLEQAVQVCYIYLNNNII